MNNNFLNGVCSHSQKLPWVLVWLLVCRVYLAGCRPPHSASAGGIVRDWGSWFSSPILPSFLVFSVQRLRKLNALTHPTALTFTSSLSSPGLAFLQGLNLSPLLCLHHIPLPEKTYLSPGLKAQAPEIFMSVFSQNPFSNVISKVFRNSIWEEVGTRWGHKDTGSLHWHSWPYDKEIMDLVLSCHVITMALVLFCHVIIF